MLTTLISFWLAVSLGVFAGSRVTDVHVRKRHSRWRFVLYSLHICIGAALVWMLVPKTSFELYAVGLYGLSVLFGIVFLKPPTNAGNTLATRDDGTE